MRALGHPIPSKTPRRAPLVALAALLLSACSHMAPGSVTRPIPRDERLVALVPSETHASLDPEPIPAAPVPPHPFMAENGASCMHGDAYTSNTYPWAGPEGHHPEVLSRAMGFVGGECPTVNFDRLGEHTVTYDDTPIELHAEDLLDRLKHDGDGKIIGVDP